MKWCTAWQYLPLDYAAVLARVTDRTQKVTFDNNLAGERVRVRLSNRYAAAELNLSRMTIGIADGDGVRDVRPVTRAGSGQIRLAPDEEAWSDEIRLSVRPGDRLAVSCYLAGPQEIESVCGFWAEGGARVVYNAAGDACGGSPFAPLPPADVYPMVAADPFPVKAQFFYGFSAVQVLTSDETKLVAAFGDSITHMSYVTNALSERLYAAFPGRAALTNCGVGGNRLTHDATWLPDPPSHGRMFGPAGVTRFEQDVFGLCEADTVLVLIGVNDIMHPVQLEGGPAPTSAEELQEGLASLIRTARSHGARICGATITPCGNPDYPAHWLPLFEKSRLAVNEWIRQSGAFDAVFDYDAAVRDPKRPAFIREGWHCGDGLHPNAEGGRQMAASVDLEKLL